jgi:endonuclease/exonuclease/phosphatase family metal-dependent hydrolase
MKLITLNIWGGKVFDPLIDFFKKHAKDTDIFCLQEVFNNSSSTKSKVQENAKQDIYSDIALILKEFDGYFAPTQEGEESLTMFVKKSLGVQEVSEKFVYRWKNAMENNDPSTYGINVQYAKFTKENKNYMICNLHGHWTPNFKGDNPARLEQSHNIKKLLDNFDGAKVLCGDFNVAPETESMRILEEKMSNLVKKYGVTSTRSKFYTGEVKFADYILVSPEIRVKDFKVLQDVVSDHLPLFLEFD